jgi:hypothetical protein
MVDRWLSDRGVAFRVKSEPDGKGRTVYVLKECPFDPSHGDPDSCVMQDPHGKLSAQCFHNSCSGRGWQDFKQRIGAPERHHYDPPLTDRRVRMRTRKRPAPGGHAERNGRCPPPEGEPPDVPDPDAQAGPDAGDTDPAHLTDRGNALRMVEMHGERLRHCHPWRKWLTWDGARWRLDTTAEATRCAKSVAVELYRLAEEEIAAARDEVNEEEADE